MFILFVAVVSLLQTGTNAIDREQSDYAKLMERGRAEYRDGQFAASEAAYLAALRTLDRTDGLRALALRELGDVYVNRDELSKAERAYSESIKLYDRLSDTKSAALVLGNLGSLYSLQRRDDEALTVIERALKLAKANPSVNHDFLPHVLNSFAVVYLRQGNLSKAESYLNQALQTVSVSGASFPTPQILLNLGALNYEKRDFKKAEKFLKEALQTSEAEVGPDHPDLTFGLVSLAMVYTQLGNYSEAEKQYQRALQILEPHKSSFETRTARVLHSLSMTYKKEGRQAEAETALGQAATLARRHLAERADMAAILEDYSDTLKRQGKRKEAEEWRGEAKRARVAAGLVISAHSPF
jgi:tetratricopeptide (TPR) repeat protein